MSISNEVRKRIWSQKPPAFLEEAILDADQILTSTTDECKEGMDISYKGA